MKTTCLFLMLLVAVSVLAADIGPVTYGKSKKPFYIDCQSNSVTLYPGSTNVTLEALQLPDNAAEKLLNQIQASNKTHWVIVMARPNSVQVFRQICKMVSERPIDVGYDVVDADFRVNWPDEVGQNLGGKLALPQLGVHRQGAYSSDKQPMLFECRSEQVFFVDHVGLREKIAQIFSALPPGMRRGDPTGFVNAINTNEVENEYYKVEPHYLAARILALEPKPAGRGDDKITLQDPNSKFQKYLLKLDSKNKHLVFLLRNDSFNIFREAREIAMKTGVDVEFQMLDGNEPIKFMTLGPLVPGQE